MKTALLFCFPVALIIAAKASDPADLQLVGIMNVSKNVGVFVSWNGQQPKLLNAMGSSIGPYRWTAVDVTKESADFATENGKSIRIFLPEGRVRAGSKIDPAVLTSLPPLEAMKGLVGLDEALARRADARTHIEKRLLYVLNKKLQDEKVPWEERTRAVEDLMTGKSKMFLVPEKGVDEAFAKKYALTPEEVAHANWSPAGDHVPPKSQEQLSLSK